MHIAQVWLVWLFSLRCELGAPTVFSLTVDQVYVFQESKWVVFVEPLTYLFSSLRILFRGSHWLLFSILLIGTEFLSRKALLLRKNYETCDEDSIVLACLQNTQGEEEGMGGMTV